jgi:pimeloyl-ACP methyl ester carboxylesterase
MPTLVLWGDEDRIVPVEQAKLWEKHLPKADVKILLGAGHCVLDEHPEAAKTVGRFIAA